MTTAATANEPRTSGGRLRGHPGQFHNHYLIGGDGHGETKRAQKDGTLMMGEDYSDFPVEPEEAGNLTLHVRNCLKRHTAMVKMLNRDRVITWIYRVIVIPAVGWIAYQMWLLPERLLDLMK